jgi:hypothetical protein
MWIQDNIRLRVSNSLAGEHLEAKEWIMKLTQNGEKNYYGNEEITRCTTLSIF